MNGALKSIVIVEPSAHALSECFRIASQFSFRHRKRFKTSSSGPNAGQYLISLRIELFEIILMNSWKSKGSRMRPRLVSNLRGERNIYHTRSTGLMRL